MPTYKVSCVITENDRPGTILNLQEEPQIGNTLNLGNEKFLIVEVIELMPPRGEFHFLHVTCKPLDP